MARGSGAGREPRLTHTRSPFPNRRNFGGGDDEDGEGDEGNLGGDEDDDDDDLPEMVPDEAKEIS